VRRQVPRVRIDDEDGRRLHGCRDCNTWKKIGGGAGNLH
jgi:hypothetical protein